MFICVIMLGVSIVMFGCGPPDIAAEFREKNKTHVAKVSTCFKIYGSRNGNQGPENQEELVEFLKGERVAKNLERLGVNPEEIDAIFVSERDGKPLKIKWGVKMNPEDPKPIAFETVGVDGIRLVGADVVLEVEDEDEYEDLWNGVYEPEWMKLKRNQGDEEQ